jgi:hypothetical protein
MKNLTGETGNLTNELEGQMVAMRQTTKPIIAALNISGKQMAKMNAKAGSIAYGLNTDAGSVAETMVAMETANEGAKKALDALKMSTSDWTKAVQTTQIPMSDYTAILGDMTASWGAAPKDAAKMIDNMMAIGKAAGVGTLALKSTKGTLDSIGDSFKSLPPGFKRTGKEIQNLVESTAYLGGALRDMGSAPEEAMTAASAAAKMFADQSVVITKAFEIGGPGADLSQSGLFKYLNALGIGADQAKGIIDLGSRDALAGMKAINKLYGQASQSQLTSAQSVLSGLGEELGQGASALTFLASSSDKGTAALDRFSKMEIKGDGAIKKYGDDAYDTGLTLQDRVNRAKLAFDTTVRSIARGDVGKLAQEQMKGMAEAGKDLLKLGKSKTYGPILKTLSMYKQMGIGGIVASLAEKSGIGAKNAAKFGAKAGLVVDTVSDLGRELAPIAQMFGMMGPFGPLLAAGGIGALFVMDDTSAKEVLGPLYNAFKTLKDKIVGFWYSPELQAGLNNAKEWIKTLWSDTIVPALPDIGSAIYGALKWAWDEVVSQLGVKGAIGVGLGAALLTGFGPPLLSAATSAAGGFLGVLKGSGGLLALAALAGVTMASKVTQSLSVDKAANEGRKIQQMMKTQGSLDNLNGGKYKNAEYLDKQLQMLTEARTVEDSSWFPDDARLRDINAGISMLNMLKHKNDKGSAGDGIASGVSGIGSKIGVSVPGASSSIPQSQGGSYGTSSTIAEDINREIQKLKGTQNQGKSGTVAAIQSEGAATRTELGRIYTELQNQSRMMGRGGGKGGRGADNSVSAP